MWAVKVAYDGTRFFGSQIQPDVPTVAGEVKRALLKNGFGQVPRFASRTDRGVSARCNVFVYEGERPRLGQLNDFLKHIWCWAYAEAPEGFNVRLVKNKEYRYVLVKDYDLKAMRKAAKQFEGTHDFRNFSRRKENTTRTLDRIVVRKKYVSFRAKGFLWEQIRRIMRTLVDAGEGRSVDVPKLFSAKDGVRPMPAEGLVLWELDHGLEWNETKVKINNELRLMGAQALEEISAGLS